MTNEQDLRLSNMKIVNFYFFRDLEISNFHEKLYSEMYEESETLV